MPEPKHLKSYITMGGPDLLCVGAGKDAQEVLKRMEREATYSYQTLTLPEDDAANVLYLNGTLVHRSLDEIPQSFKVNALLWSSRKRNVLIRTIFRCLERRWTFREGP